MREASFIKQNKDKWLEFENYLYYDLKVEPGKLADLYIQLNNDLAFTQTYYPKSKVNIYLNALASNAYLKIVKPKTAYGSIQKFWKYQVPFLVYKHRKYIYFAFTLFILVLGIGIISSLYDEAFIRAVLGDSYVDLTMQNITTGDPAAIYTNNTRLGDTGSFLGITINNIRVGLLMYISGITMGIGTLKILFSNGVMLGSFLTMFYEAGVFAKSMSAVWIHGSMEIFVMVVEAGMGFLLGLGWLFPGSFTRMQAFKRNGKESLMILLSTIPFTVFAGFLEGFVTQYYNDLHWSFSLTVILTTLGIISYYYLVYPIRLFGRSGLTINDLIGEDEE